MNIAHRSALLCLVCAAVPLAAACGSNDSSGLFSSGGSVATSVAGSLGSSGSVSHSGQSAGGAANSSSSSGGSASVAGHGTSGDSTGGSGGAASAGAAGDSGGSGGDAAGSGGSGGASASGGGTSGGGASGGGTSGGGASGGGTSGGGTSGGGASGGGTSGGGTSGGGASGGGTSGGGTSGGGAGGSAGSGCPQDMPPQDGTMCTTPTPDNCFYPGRACSCLPDAQSAAARRWGCYGTPDRCPGPNDTHPSDGASCKGFNGGMCPYSVDDYCVCIPGPGGGNGNEPRWACDQNAICPVTRPGNTLCGAVKECAYADRECFCNAMSWGCE